MAIDQVYIYNLALNAIGNQSYVAVLGEGSLEEQTCTLWYESIRDQVFRAAPWGELKGNFRLALYATRNNDLAWQNTDPAPGWNYAYLLPPDYIYPRNLTDYTKFDPGSMADGTQVLNSNSVNPILTYTKRVIDPSKWFIDLQQAVGFALGAAICKRLTGSTNGVQQAYGLANDKIMVARTNNANVDGWQPQSTPEWIQARGSAYDTPFSPFLFPSADYTISGFNNVS